MGLSFDLRSDVRIFRLTHTLEHLEGAFYTAVVANANFNSFFNEEEREILTDLRNVETGGNGSNNGPFQRATRELDFLLLTTQAFEDTGVRAYKGQAGRLLINSNNTADIVLESALRIHSVEARHASKIRRIRRMRNPGDTSLRFPGYVRGGGGRRKQCQQPASGGRGSPQRDLWRRERSHLVQ